MQKQISNINIAPETMAIPHNLSWETNYEGYKIHHITVFISDLWLFYNKIQLLGLELTVKIR